MKCDFLLPRNEPPLVFWGDKTPSCLLAASKAKNPE